MLAMKPDLERFLKGLVGSDRYATEDLETTLYDRDLAPIPSIALTLFKTRPTAIVQPISTEEISEIVAYAFRNSIPITPRGAATYGFGGALATRSGLMIDLRRMRKILNFDEKGLTIRVQAGITWKELINYLEWRGYTVATYPSSAISATVGGWIATGGYGFGSLKYGHLSKHVKSMKVVLPSFSKMRNIVDVPSQEYPLELFFETEGTFGVITEVELRIRALPEATLPLLASFEDEGSMFSFVNKLLTSDIKPHTIEFFDPNYISLMNEIEKTGLEAKPHVIAFYEGNKEEVQKGKEIFSLLASQCRGKIESTEAATHKWENRFSLIKVKRLGPTLLGQDLVIPNEKLEKYASIVPEIAKKHDMKASYSGMIVTPADTVFMPMLLTDERRRWKYIMELPVLKDLCDKALEIGGKPYGLGIWNHFYLKEAWGEKRTLELRNMKRRVDPKGVMNPDKIFAVKTRMGVPLTGSGYSLGMRLLKAASFLKPISGKAKTQERISGIKLYYYLSGIFDDLYTCAKCGYCASVCPAFTEVGWESITTRGRIHLSRRCVEKGEPLVDPMFVKRLYQCTLCGRCKEFCPTGIDTVNLLTTMREHAVETNLAPSRITSLPKTFETNHNPFEMKHEYRVNWFDERARENKRLIRKLEKLDSSLVQKLRYTPLKIDDIIKPKAKVVYFVGCNSSYYGTNSGIADAMIRIMREAGEDFTILSLDEWCCGDALALGGLPRSVEEIAKHNVEAIRKRGAEVAVFTCSGCYRMFKHEYPKLLKQDMGFEVLHSTELLEKYLNEGKLKVPTEPVKLTYHDPCELGRLSGIYEQPRNVLRKQGVEIVEMAENKGDALCCGGGGLLKMTDQPLSKAFGSSRIKQVEDCGTNIVITGCPACKMTLEDAAAEKKKNIKVLDIVEFTAQRLNLLPPEK